MRFTGKKYTGGRCDNEVDAAITHDKLVVQYCGPIIKKSTESETHVKFSRLFTSQYSWPPKQYLKVVQPNEHLLTLEVFGEVEDERSSANFFRTTEQDHGPLTF